MPALLLDESEVEQVLESRKKSGSYCWVEVWAGLYIVPPLPDNLHSELSLFFRTAFAESLQSTGARCCGHVNVSDRNKDWLTNVRCPDAAVFLPGNRARDRFTHWQGGPDLAVEVTMAGDWTRLKLGFYGEIGTKEVVILDRKPWQLELYRLRRGQMRSSGIAKPGSKKTLISAVVPFEFQLVRGTPRPKVKITHTETGQEWVG